MINIKKPIASMCICNTSGMAIYDMDEMEGSVQAAYVVVDKGIVGHLTWCKIHYTSNGRSYFRKNGNRYYLDQFVKI